MRYLFFLSMPHTSVTPYKATKFISTPGFMVRYNTSNPEILNEWHEVIVSLVGKGLFISLSESTRLGYFPYPEDKKHLQQYVKRFL